MSQGKLSREQVQEFQDKGYLVIKDFISQDQIQNLVSRATEIVENFDFENNLSFFDTSEENAAKRDSYFVDSSNKVSVFSEVDAVKDGKLVVDKKFAANKIGHALHDKDPVFREFSLQPAMYHVARSIGLQRPIICQSMYIYKSPGVGGGVSPHQDSSFLYTDPKSCVGLWFALDDADETNGCLRVIEGSHKEGLTRRWVATDQPNKFKFVNQDSHPNFDIKEWEDRDAEFKPVCVTSGSIVLLHGELVHSSYPNRSGKRRNAYTMHVVDSNAQWASDNWLQRPENDPFPELSPEASH
eukprot:gb/GECH01013823.1/.p1 GENE.gb/GECH01013823.1/~~gb/GECH01013823.1/.p1  ORF type:complete len:298 (+),score=90.74 gb/GECH01013823.1/:1-894(+)